MHIVKVGFNYQVAPLEIREKLTFSDDNLAQAMIVLNEQYDVFENIIISTCNRTEVFAVVEESDIGINSIQQFLIDWFHIDGNQVLPYLNNLKNNDAIEHLFRLAIGLDSMVIGETQILGQLKNAFLTAQEIKATGKLFNELFKRVITFAKRAHKDTMISEKAVSISYVAVELSKKIFGHIEDKHVVILGAGEMAELALKNLQGAGVKKITVVNRTMERAEKLAIQFNAKAVHMGQLLYVLKDADILISSTSSDHVVLTKDSLQPLQKQRFGNPLFVIDIAVPRDIDSSVEELESVFLYDIDDLHGVVDKNVETRKEAVAVIETQLGYELSDFYNWIAMLDAVPAIKALREKSLGIQEKTLKSIHRKIPDLTEREMKVLQKHTKSIINQILEDPIKKVKDMGRDQKSIEELEIFMEIFGLKVQDDKKLSIQDNFIFHQQNEMNPTRH